MKKYILFIVMIVGCGSLLIGCGSNDEDVKGDQDTEESKESEASAGEEEGDTDNLIGDTKEDIKFGTKENMGEEDSIEDAISFLGEIEYPDIKFKNDDKSRYFVRKEDIREEEPNYFLNLMYWGDDSNGNSTFIQHYVFTNEEDFEEKASEATDTKTLSDGTEVRWKIEENKERRAYLKKGDYYYILSTPNEEEKMSDETFLNAIEGMSKQNHIYEKVKEGVDKSVENHFIMPTYFPENIELNEVTINKIALSFYYTGGYYVDGKEDERVFSSVKHSVSNELSLDVDEDEEVELPSGREAYLHSHEGYSQDDLVFKEDGIRFKVTATDIERPLDNEEKENLIKIADSIEVE